MKVFSVLKRSTGRLISQVKCIFQKMTYIIATDDSLNRGNNKYFSTFPQFCLKLLYKHIVEVWVTSDAMSDRDDGTISFKPMQGRSKVPIDVRSDGEENIISFKEVLMTRGV